LKIALEGAVQELASLVSWSWSRSLLTGLCLVSAGCLYDPDDRCGPYQVLNGAEQCVCEPGRVLRDRDCELCPENEQEVDGVCECVDGYSRPVEGQACAPAVEGGLGTRCSASQPCTDPIFGTCQAGGSAGDYCTRRGCTGDDECGTGFACNLLAEPSFCQRAPSGLGLMCSSQDDCAGSDASFCDTFISNACLVPNCSLEAPDCFAGWECCDISSVPIPGIPKSVCVPIGECSL
jgi:hypothetical protein